jgi:small subunit ribosomal protein S21
MNGVQGRGTEHVEKMLKRFKRVTESAGMLTEIKRRRAYEKPCDKKRRERNAAIRKAHFVPQARKKKSRR